MCDERLRDFLLDSLISLFGDQSSKNKLAGSQADQREIVSPLLSIPEQEADFSPPDNHIETLKNIEKNPENMLAFWLSTTASDPEVTSLIDSPLLEIEVVLTSADAFTRKLSTSDLPRGTAVTSFDQEQKTGVCIYCGAEVEMDTAACPSCELPLHAFRKFPLVEGGTLRTSYNFLREMLTWPEVVSINSKKKFFPT